MRRARGLAAAALAPLCLASCQFGEQTIAPGTEQLAVHGVLNPGQFLQLILVERTLTGRIDVNDDVPFDPRNPIVSGGGVPVSNARVVVYGPAGDSAVAHEEPAAPGVYGFINDVAPPPGGREALPVTPGGRYRLRVESPEGVVTGETTIPSTPPASVGASFERFNRDRDSIFVFWSEVPGASRFALRIDTPRGPFLAFVDSLEYLVSGRLRNTFAEGIPHVFVPGFNQQVSVGAVDRNYFDYYRSLNDPFTGTGLINHLDGGIGVFGSYVLIRHRRLNVVADVDEAPEGRYVRTFGGTTAHPGIMQLYIDAHSGGVVQITGFYTRPTDIAPQGLIGTASRTSITIAFLREQLVGDTLTVLEGRFDGPNIVGRFRGSDDRVTFTFTPLP